MYPPQMAISQIPALTAHTSFLCWELIFSRPGVGRCTPLKWQFHRFLLWQLIFHSYSENSYLANQVLVDLLPQPTNGYYRFVLWELILGRPSVGRSTPYQMAISRIPALTVHISFLLWELILGRPSVGRSTHTTTKWQL